MFNQIEKSNFIELTTEEQQHLAGGYCCSPSYKPPVCCGCNYYSEPMPYQEFGYSSSY